MAVKRERAIDPTVWQRPETQTALAERDIATVYRILQRRCGISQRRIAALTGQTLILSRQPSAWL